MSHHPSNVATTEIDVSQPLPKDMVRTRASQEQRRLDQIKLLANSPRAEHDISGPMHIKLGPNRQIQAHGMATSIPDDALRRSRCPAGVDDVQPLVGVHGHRLSPDPPGPAAPHFFEPVDLAPARLDPVPPELVALPDENAAGLVLGHVDCVADEGRVAQRGLVALDTAGRREDGGGTGRLYALGERLCAEAAEDDGVDGPEARDGEDADEGLGDHGHFWF